MRWQHKVGVCDVLSLLDLASTLSASALVGWMAAGALAWLPLDSAPASGFG